MHTGAFKEHGFVKNTKKNPKNILKIQKQQKKVITFFLSSTWLCLTSNLSFT